MLTCGGFEGGCGVFGAVIHVNGIEEVVGSNPTGSTKFQDTAVDLKSLRWHGACAPEAP